MNQLEIAKRRLFDQDGLAASNFGVTLGSSRDVTSEQIAEQVNRAISQIEAGDFESMALDD